MRAELYHPLRFDLPRVVHYTAGTLMGLVTLDSRNLDYSRSQEFCRLLEDGEILFFPRSPIQLADEDISFLLDQKQVKAGYRKNIAYKPQRNVVSGATSASPQDSRRLLEVMRTFTRSVTRFLESFLSPYAPGWNVDYASFRPQQEEGRRVKFKARNDLLHVDAFPTRPTRGDRIFRFFLNINPVESRRWVTSDTFERLLGTYVGTPEMPFPAAQEGIHSRWSRHLSRWGKALGLPLAAPSRYDDFMLRLHDHLKANRKFQQAEARYRLEFPPGSSWMVFTDFVPHAALSGQFALEQTLVIGRRSMLQPEKAPICLLEKASGVSPLA